MTFRSKQILTLILASLLLVAPLASCATESEHTGDSASEGTTAVLEEDTAIKDNLPDGLNYGGEEINFYSFYEEGMTSGQVTVPELNSNPIKREPSKHENIGMNIARKGLSGPSHACS